MIPWLVVRASRPPAFQIKPSRKEANDSHLVVQASRLPAFQLGHDKTLRMTRRLGGGRPARRRFNGAAATTLRMTACGAGVPPAGVSNQTLSQRGK